MTKTNKLFKPPGSRQSEATTLNRTSSRELTSPASNQAAASRGANVQGESVIRFSDPPNTSGPHIRAQNVSEGRGDERVTQGKLAARRWSRFWTTPGEVDWILWGGTNWTPGPETDREPLSSTDGFIKDLEDGNRLDRGPHAVPCLIRAPGKARPLWVKAHLNNSLHHH